MQVVGTGAGGAGLVLAFMAHAAATEAADGEAAPVGRQQWPAPAAATVAYACDSPALLRLVTNELLARKASHDRRRGTGGTRAAGAKVSVVTALFPASSSPSPSCAEAEEEGCEEMKAQQQQQQGQMEEGLADRLRNRASQTSSDSLLHCRLNLQVSAPKAGALLTARRRGRHGADFLSSPPELGDLASTSSVSMNL